MVSYFAKSKSLKQRLASSFLLATSGMTTVLSGCAVSPPQTNDSCVEQRGLHTPVFSAQSARFSEVCASAQRSAIAIRALTQANAPRSDIAIMVAHQQITQNNLDPKEQKIFEQSLARTTQAIAIQDPERGQELENIRRLSGFNGAGLNGCNITASSSNHPESNTGSNIRINPKDGTTTVTFTCNTPPPTP